MDENLRKVLTYIEENIRISEQTTIEYLDPKNHINRLNSRQNQVVFGRRGSGKSLLLKSLRKNDLEAKLYISINIEDFKDISFPNSISQVLINVIKKIRSEVKGNYTIFQFSNFQFSKKLGLLCDLLWADPEKETTGWSENDRNFFFSHFKRRKYKILFFKMKLYFCFAK